MTRRKSKVVTVRVLNANTSEFDGPGVLDALKRLSVVHMRSRHGGGWSIPGRHTDDLMAYLEARGHRIEPTL